MAAQERALESGSSHPSTNKARSWGARYSATVPVGRPPTGVEMEVSLRSCRPKAREPEPTMLSPTPPASSGRDDSNASHPSASSPASSRRLATRASRARPGAPRASHRRALSRRALVRRRRLRRLGTASRIDDRLPARTTVIARRVHARRQIGARDPTSRAIGTGLEIRDGLRQAAEGPLAPGHRGDRRRLTCRPRVELRLSDTARAAAPDRSDALVSGDRDRRRCPHGRASRPDTSPRLDAVREGFKRERVSARRPRERTTLT